MILKTKAHDFFDRIVVIWAKNSTILTMIAIFIFQCLHFHLI